MSNKIGKVLKSGLKEIGKTQKWLADELYVDPSRVSRWATGDAIIPLAYGPKIDSLIKKNITQLIEEASLEDSTDYDIFLATPMGSLCDNTYIERYQEIEALVTALRDNIGSVYWGGDSIATPEDFDVSDIGTENNIAALKKADAFVFVHYDSTPVASSALIELGIALGLKKPTTIFVSDISGLPHMMEGFAGIAERLKFLPRVRIYELGSSAEAIRLVKRSGREILL